MRRAWLLAALLPLTSCVGYMRFQVDEPISMSALAQLRPGASELAECLAVLGAPDQVFEYRGSGMALLWSWRDTDDWSLNVSIPVTDVANASFEFDMTAREIPGCVLWISPDLLLERWQVGSLGHLLAGRTRPAVVE